MKILNTFLSPDSLSAALEAASKPAFKLSFSLLLITASLGATYIGSEGNFPGIELRDVLARGTVVIVVLLLGALAISLRSRTVANAALALVTLACMFTAYLVHTELFHPTNRIWLVVFCAATGVSLFAAFRIMDEARKGGPALTAAALLPFAVLTWQIVAPMLLPRLIDGFNTLHGLLDLGSFVIWIALVGVCACAALALYLWFRTAHSYRWGGAILAGAMVLATSLVLQKLWPRLMEGLDTPGGLLDLGSFLRLAALIGVWAGSAVAIYLSIRAKDPNLWGAFAGTATLLLLAAAIIWLGIRHGEGGDGYYEHGWEDHPNVQAVAFKETPNLYLIGFESISPEALMHNHMGIESTDFHRTVDEKMRRFRNLFASAVHTRNSFRSIMALELDIILNHQEAAGSLPSYFAGHDLSPLVWILRENGYVTSSLYENTMFGRIKGTGIDNYKVNTWRSSVACSLLDQDVRRLAFWGYCWSQVENISDLPFGEFLIQELGRLGNRPPQFVIAHNPLPGHPSNLFDPEDIGDREEFFDVYERNSNRAAGQLERLIEHVKVSDPDGILFVFGDHGPLLAKGLGIEDDPTFFLQDRFGILGGIYPPDRCSAELDEAESKGYVTSLDIVHAILECLSGGQSPLREPRNDRFWGSGVPEDHSYKYEDFLYE